MRKDKYLTETQIERIIELIRTTDLSFKDIATRMGCHDTLVAKINREHGGRTPPVTQPKKQKPRTRFYVRDIKGGFL